MLRLVSHIKWIKLDTGHSIGSTVSTWQLSFYFWQRWPKFKPKFTSKKFRLFTILMLLIFHWWVTEECGKVVKLCTVLNIVFCLYVCNHSVPYWEWLTTARLSLSLWQRLDAAFSVALPSLYALVSIVVNSLQMPLPL